MKRLPCFALVLMLVLLYAASGLADSAKPLYSATARISCTMYEKMDTSSRQVGRIYGGSTVKVYSLTPEWVYLSYNGDKGYAQRKDINAGKPLDNAATPPWGVEVYRYAATLAHTASIYDSTDADASALITLGAGAKISIISIENGWGKVAYYRQYGYINTNDLSELLPVCRNASAGTDEAPIATFTSYYVTGSSDVSVGGKEINIGVNCAEMNGDILRPGKQIDYNDFYGSFSRSKGYVLGPVLISTGWGLGYGGGVCQVSSTLYNVLLQLPGVRINERRSHGSDGAAYLPLDMDAAVGADGINMRYTNNYNFPIRFEAKAQDGALFIAVYRVTE